MILWIVSKSLALSYIFYNPRLLSRMVHDWQQCNIWESPCPVGRTRSIWRLSGQSVTHAAVSDLFHLTAFLGAETPSLLLLEEWLTCLKRERGKTCSQILQNYNVIIRILFFKYIKIKINNENIITTFSTDTRIYYWNMKITNRVGCKKCLTKFHRPLLLLTILEAQATSSLSILNLT